MKLFDILLQDYMLDLKAYFTVVKKVNFSVPGIDSLALKELELYHKMPREIFKITPLIVVSVLPFANYVIFPLAYYFPRQLLTRHFWSLQQRSEFAIIVQRKRLKWYKPVFRSLQAQLDGLQSHACYKDWEYVIRLLGSGLHPSPRTIIKCKPLFAESPYHLRRLYQSHARALLKMHNMHTGWRRRTRLAERAEFLQLMDQAIVREGGVSKLSIEELKWEMVGK
ncbi:hypothetical protein LSTR_LSTR015903 [Laodelphax striatellus]|uniref:Letm1 RBD domain-containing protein n=1 Tax=Laodelphax striatellus TaxID=195883 RepID=A0A482WP84_LAOST|nr:hypothetical protein LSTR_LSTR015903 [Laodelphax striatellus]